MKTLIPVLLCTFVLAGCGVQSGSPNCTLTQVLNIGTPTEPPGDPNHSLSPPGNQEQFTASIGYTAPPGCAVPALLILAKPAWTVSNATDVEISSAQDATNGLATCLAATTAPVTVTATNASTTQPSTTLTATTTMTCY